MRVGAPTARSKSAWAWLAGCPEGVELRVLQLDHTLLGLQEFGQVGLPLLKEVFQV
jgi:hypothetical protein